MGMDWRAGPDLRLTCLGRGGRIPWHLLRLTCLGRTDGEGESPGTSDFMKKTVKKLMLSKEILRDLDTKLVVGGGDDTQDTTRCLTRVNCGVLGVLVGD